MSPRFSDLGIPDALVRVLTDQGITEPFPIQAATIPDGLARRDLRAQAPTGSGKTLAFGLPLVATVERAHPRRPRALILVPTRELAEQIHRDLLPLAQAMGRRIAPVYGGTSFHPQLKALRGGVDIVVACPGRLTDLVEQGEADLSDVNQVVIDEADRMADMGFMPQVRALLDLTSTPRQTTMFSATCEGDVAKLSKQYQSDPVWHNAIADVRDDVEPVPHFFWRVQAGDRASLTSRVVKSVGRTIVFTRTRHGADRLAGRLESDGVRAVAIHGGRNQAQRDRALADFVAGRAHALVATDVAARGIHVDGVACVLHFDPPEDATTYRHRSGRTGRAGSGGMVLSFVEASQIREARKAGSAMGLSVNVNEPDLNQLPAVAPALAQATVPTPRPSVQPTRTGRAPAPERHAPRDASNRATRRAETGPRQHTGVVKFFDTKRGFGFIARPAKSDVFVHYSRIATKGVQALSEGQHVEFKIVPGRNGDEAHEVTIA